MYLLVFINCLSIFGYATFVKHPALLQRYEWSLPIFVVSYPFFAQIQIATGFAIVFFACLKEFGKKLSLKLLFSAFGISLFMELLGTTYGVPFGKYTYTNLLGWKILSQVPFWIPVSWFCMSLVSWGLANQILGEIRHFGFKILLGSVLLLTWDVTLDPAMSEFTPYWIWDQPQNFLLHMPIRNLAGWFLTGCLIMASFHFCLLGRRQKWIRADFPLKFYVANLLLPIGFAVIEKVWLPILVTGIVGIVCFGIAKYFGNTREFGIAP